MEHDVVELALQFARGTKWPGGVVGALGALILGVVIVAEELADRLASAEYLGALVVGATLALAGPFVVAYSTRGARRDAVEVKTSDNDLRRVEAELELENARNKAREFSELES